MPITLETIEQIATLARLKPETTQDNHSIQNDLVNILKMVDQISSINTNGITPLSHPLEMAQALRKDEVTEPNEREILLSLAPQSEAGLFIVPAVIEE